jgi:hypothetical protein
MHTCVSGWQHTIQHQSADLEHVVFAGKACTNVTQFKICQHIGPKQWNSFHLFTAIAFVSVHRRQRWFESYEITPCSHFPFLVHDIFNMLCTGGGAKVAERKEAARLLLEAHSGNGTT